MNPWPWSHLANRGCGATKLHCRRRLGLGQDVRRLERVKCPHFLLPQPLLRQTQIHLVGGEKYGNNSISTESTSSASHSPPSFFLQYFLRAMADIRSHTSTLYSIALAR